ncbi:MAG: type II toxin-antitoxin system VapC family toxin [Caldilinea sp.]
MLTIDASVWVSAADRTDALSLPSRQFLTSALRRQLPIYLPSFAWLEIACALTRRRQDAVRGQQLANMVLTSPSIMLVECDGALLAQAQRSGAQAYLRAADALYVATATLHATALISWDQELIRRAGAITPVDWLTANP